MTESLSTFRQEAREWLTENAPTVIPPLGGQEARDFVLSWQKAQAEGGWAGIAWPREMGGRGASVREQIVWFEEYARAHAPSPLDASFVGLNHAGPTLIVCGSDEQKAFHLPKILNGDVLWCQGFSEPGAGSDLAGIRTKGHIEGDMLVINGQKTWSSFADIADYQELLVKTDVDARTSKAFTWIICPMDTPGITVRPIPTMAGDHKYCEVFYDDVRIPLSNIVGGMGNGWATAMSTLAFERGTSSLALLMALILKVEKVLKACSKDRTHMRARLAQLRAEGAALRAMTYGIALDSANSTPDSSGSFVRVGFSEYGQRVNEAVLDFYGVSNPEVTRLRGGGYDYLEAFSETIAGGTSEIQRNIIAERVLGLPRGPR